MNAPESVLEHNLRRLFARAWAPVAPRESFRAALEGEFTRAAARRYGARAPDERAAWRRPVQLALTLAASFLVAWIGVGALLERWRPDWIGDGGAHGALELAAVAVRSGGADWEEVPVPVGAARVDLGRRELPLEVATTTAIAARIELGVGQLDIGPGAARFTLEEERRAALASGNLAAQLAAGQVLLVQTLAGAVELDGARARIAYEGAERDVVRIEVDAGSARIEDRPGWHTLAAGGRARLRDGRVLIEPTAAADPGARAEVPVAAAEEPASEPAAEPALSGSVTALAVGADGVERPLSVARYRVLLLEEVPLPGAAMPDVLDVEDEAGRFAFAAVEPGRYSLFVQADGFAVARREHLELGGEPVDVALELARGTTVRGTVLDASTGAGVSGAVVVSETDSPVRVLPIDRASLDEMAFVRFTLSGPGGAFELQGVSRGRQVLRASDGGLSVGWAEPFELEGAAPLEGIEIRVPPGGALAGEVRDERGAPRAGVFLLASCTDFTKPYPCLSYKPTLTDAEGHFQIDGVPPGTVAVLLFGDPELLDEDTAPDLRLCVVRAGETTRVDFAPPSSTLSLAGRVVDPSGAPVAGRSLWTLPTGSEPTESMLISTTTAPDGTFTFEGLEAGPRELFVSIQTPPEMVWLAHVELPLVGAERVELTAGAGVLAGRVRSAATLEPVVSGKLVLLEHPMGSFAGQVLLGPDGTFRFERLRAGRYDVIVQPTDPALGEATAEGLEVAASGAAGEIEILAPVQSPK